MFNPRLVLGPVTCYQYQMMSQSSSTLDSTCPADFSLTKKLPRTLQQAGCSSCA